MSDIYEKHAAYCSEHYPQITEQYYNFINSTRNSEMPLLNFSEEMTNAAIEQAYTELEQGRKNTAYDALVMCSGVYKHSGFIIGFITAMRFMKESFVTMGGINI